MKLLKECLRTINNIIEFTALERQVQDMPDIHIDKQKQKTIY